MTKPVIQSFKLRWLVVDLISYTVTQANGNFVPVLGTSTPVPDTS